jgi:hypothetical protein
MKANQHPTTPHHCPIVPAPVVQWPIDMPPPKPDHSDSVSHEVGIDMDMFVAVLVHELGYTGAPTPDEQPYIQAGLAYAQTHDFTQLTHEPAYVMAVGVAHMQWNVHYF